KVGANLLLQQPRYQQLDLHVIKALAKGWHDAVTAAGNTGDNRSQIAAVHPVVIRQVGGAKHGVATAVRSVAGRTVGIEGLLTRMSFRLGCPETKDISSNVVDLWTDDIRPRHHECLTP